MTVVGNVLRFKDFQAMQNIEGEILNVYYYKIVSQTGSPVLNNMSAQIEDWWRNEFLPPILACQVEGVNHVRVDVDNMNAVESEFLSIAMEEGPQGGCSRAIQRVCCRLVISVNPSASHNPSRV